MLAQELKTNQTQLNAVTAELAGMKKIVTGASREKNLEEEKDKQSEEIETLVRVGPKQTVLTPFRDGIWNCHQVSVGDRGSFPHDPETIGDMPSWQTCSAK